MKFFRSRALWFTIYGIIITILFLYLLFPGHLLKSRLESAASLAGFNLKSSSLHASFPLGIKLKNVTLENDSLASGPLFQGETLNVQYSWQNLLDKNTHLGLRGSAYNGSFKGSIAVPSLERFYPPARANLDFESIDLQKVRLIRNKLGREISGRAKGSLNYKTDAGGKIADGAVNISISAGSYPLVEPFLGIEKIDFEIGQIQAVFKDGSIVLEKVEIFGGRVNCLLAGEIIPADNFTQSRLNLRGTIEVAGKDKIKMQVTIGGTLANPVFKYI
ncbi:MAG TPA: type II secretion system protein GspN [Smithellaceae bacterium]|nr:type II secretion system protein GspN [Smithellaceae bacterium]HRS89661.1 type II secretion system protein GspN [Smithellaceae bacterium]HRV25214.1 type II secretion system protein GspN [Smithellaceae bacterium]